MTDRQPWRIDFSELNRFFEPEIVRQLESEIRIYWQKFRHDDENRPTIKERKTALSDYYEALQNARVVLTRHWNKIDQETRRQICRDLKIEPVAAPHDSEQIKLAALWLESVNLATSVRRGPRRKTASLEIALMIAKICEENYYEIVTTPDSRFVQILKIVFGKLGAKNVLDVAAEAVAIHKSEKKSGDEIENSDNFQH